MKHFFMEYGKIIVVGALTVTGLMFTTPFAEAVTGSVANFATGMNDKYEPWELIDGDNVVLTDNDGDGVASKGDFLTFKASYLYSNGCSGPTKFLVLNSDGNTAELMAKTNYRSSKFNETSVTTNDSAGNTVQKYEGSTLDTLLNETYYNILSNAIKDKIRSKEITQYAWILGSEYLSNEDAIYTSAFSNCITKYRQSGTIGTYNRKIYALDFMDVMYYLGKNATEADVNNMFFGTNSRVSGYVWLRSASTYSNKFSLFVDGNVGRIINRNSEIYEHLTYPAFTITLREGFF